MQNTPLKAIDCWQAGQTPAAFDPSHIREILSATRETVHVVRREDDGAVGVALGGEIHPLTQINPSRMQRLGTLPPLYPEWLGDRSFQETHGVRFPYISGAMANGIATPTLVASMAKAEMLGFFGAGGLSLPRVEAGLAEIRTRLGGDAQSAEYSWGANLIHSPHEPELEATVADLYIQNGVRRVSASAYMALTTPLVRLACKGLHVDAGGRVGRRHHIFAKVSRPEVARHFLEPAPEDMLQALLKAGQLTHDEVQLARHVPVAEDFIVEADSGGHTDNRPLQALFPLLATLRDEISREREYDRPIRLGAAGGIGTPRAASSAFAMGAAFVLTGSINQSAYQSGLSEAGRALLAKADMADVIMAPSPDMFELGVKVQVLRRGTLFAQRAQRLYDLYMTHESYDSISEGTRQQIEKDIFQASADDVWAETARFWQGRNPDELQRAETNPKHRMALMFRWYVGLSSRWAIQGVPERQLDYQIWCGPAMGAFNRWVKGSYLEAPESRCAVQIAYNLLEGAAVLTRAHQLRTYGAAIAQNAFDYRPRHLSGE